MGNIISVLVVLLAIYIIAQIRKTVYKIDDYDPQYFADLNYSSQTFYKDVEAAVRQIEMPGVEISRITYYETNILSRNREYLRIGREKLVFDICAAPFGKGFFVSTREGMLPGLRHKLLLAIPFIGGYLAYIFFKKTYYQVDSQSMFVGAVHDTVNKAIKDIQDGKTIVVLSAAEQQPANAED